MENNPVKQRVLTLTEQWRQSVMTMPDVRLFCWIGASTVDYKMIQGFITYHMSEESTIDDIFFSFKHSFKEADPVNYGGEILKDIENYIITWNNDKDLVDKMGIIPWQLLKKEEKDNDEKYFVKNINFLSEKLNVNGKDKFLVLAFLPQAVENFGLYSKWFADLMLAGISSKVRIMIYDNYDYQAFEGLSKQFPEFFHKLHTDLNMTGAMHQILENVKAGKADKQERDAVTFQQLIIKITEAIGQNDKRKLDIYSRQGLELAQEHNWPHMEAMVHYFVHSWYVIKNQQADAHKELDHAINKNDKAFDLKILSNEDVRYYYRVAKGNLFYMNKKFSDASVVFRSCLTLKRGGIDKQLLLSVYQMLGDALKHSGDCKSAWQYFLEGWEIVNVESEEVVRSNKLIQYYANQMLQVAPDGDNGVLYYRDLFSKYWGRDWEKNLTEVHGVSVSRKPSFFS